MKILEDFAQILFPVRCFGCARLGLTLCASCRKRWHPHAYRTFVANIPVYSSVSYSPVAKKILLSAKENGHSEADQLLVTALMHALNSIPMLGTTSFLVPIPASRSSKRRRGRDFVAELTHAISQESGIPMVKLLELKRKVRDQSKLNARGRSRNLSGAIGIIERAQAFSFSGSDAILVDDLVTTGSTLSEGVRALTSGGIAVVACVTACTTHPLR